MKKQNLNGPIESPDFAEFVSKMSNNISTHWHFFSLPLYFLCISSVSCVCRQTNIKQRKIYKYLLRYYRSSIGLIKCLKCHKSLGLFKLWSCFQHGLQAIQWVTELSGLKRLKRHSREICFILTCRTTEDTAGESLNHYRQHCLRLLIASPPYSDLNMHYFRNQFKTAV